MEATEKDGQMWVKKLGGIPRTWEEAKEKTLAIWREEKKEEEREEAEEEIRCKVMEEINQEKEKERAKEGLQREIERLVSKRLEEGA
jgi:hypothetical protein